MIYLIYHELIIVDHSSAFIVVDVPGDLAAPDGFHEVLELHLDIFPSAEVCGHSKVTLNGQSLSVKPHGEVLVGKGHLNTKENRNIDASWKINCITVNGKPDAQFLKFSVDAIEGRNVIDVGFSSLFRQTGNTEIIHIINDVMIPDLLAANPNPEALVPTDNAMNPTEPIQQEIQDLEWLMAQMHELELLIGEKQKIIAEHASKHHQNDIKDCDSLKCVVATITDLAKHAAHDAYERVAGHGKFERISLDHDHPFRGPPDYGRGKHGDRPNAPPSHPPYSPHKPHKHRNETFPRKPHHWLPICRMPPHHRYLHGPPFHSPPHHNLPHGPPPPGPPPPGHPYPGHPQFPPPPPPGAPPPVSQWPFEDELEKSSPVFPPPPPFRPVSHIVTFVVVGFVAAFLLAALHLRVCTPKRKADRRARREERRERRRSVHKSFISRLLAKMAGSDHSSDSYDEKSVGLLTDMEDGLSTTMSEEIVQLQNAASVVDSMVCHEEGRTREQVQVNPRNPSFPQGQPLAIQTQSLSPLAHGYNLASPGVYDQLPAYEGNGERGTDSDMVSDGFGYTPDSSRYTPSNSDSGSVSDILGPDTKS